MDISATPRPGLTAGAFLCLGLTWTRLPGYPVYSLMYMYAFVYIRVRDGIQRKPANLLTVVD